MDATHLQSLSLPQHITSKLLSVNEQLEVQESAITNLVSHVLSLSPPREFSIDDIQALYTYNTPLLGEGGSCSIKEEIDPTPFDISNCLFGNPLHYESLTSSHLDTTICLWRLNRIVDELQKITTANWVGIYKKVPIRNEKEKYSGLVKLVYRGEISRPIFPLTSEFEEISNNSWVGINGKAKIIEDLSVYEGPYYNCSSSVRSELCVPLKHNGEIIGIVDAESWIVNFFSNANIENVWRVLRVCFDLGRSDLSTEKL
eukprot:TRINITY_DN8011_c0_g1_i1.p1 TRINITY_DN8011_c0_g1~~TRINITY_DN8011_c0_g1_i1.p1  ORF type:complete len:258 (-),score=50.67 TRINITY_DN8011_c0_g1_i1:165-938(-)